MPVVKLARFQEWMAESGKSPATIKVYSAAVRRLLAGAAVRPDEELSAAVQEAYAGLTLVQQAGAVSAWKVFRKFAQEQGAEAPALEPPVSDLPTSVIAAVSVLVKKHRISETTIPHLRWPSVDLSSGTVTLPDASVRIVEARHLEALAAWGGTAPAGYVLPAAPGARVPMRPLRIRAIVGAEFNMAPDRRKAVQDAVAPPMTPEQLEEYFKAEREKARPKPPKPASGSWDDDFDYVVAVSDEKEERRQ